jgi:hypothetical protein
VLGGVYPYTVDLVGGDELGDPVLVEFTDPRGLGVEVGEDDGAWVGEPA